MGQISLIAIVDDRQGQFNRAIRHPQANQAGHGRKLASGAYVLHEMEFLVSVGL